MVRAAARRRACSLVCNPSIPFLTPAIRFSNAALNLACSASVRAYAKVDKAGAAAAQVLRRCEDSNG